MRTAVHAMLILVVLAAFARAQEPFVGNTLITPVRSTETYLIDMDHNILQTWHGANGAGHTVYLLADGSVIRGQGDPAAPISGGGGSGGHFQRIDSSDHVVWDYFFSNEEHQAHHDFEPMPNGNILVIAWEIRSAEEVIAAGRTAPTTGDLRPTLLVELEPVGSNDANVVWEWRIWDHIIQDSDPAKPNYGAIADHPERVDINAGNARGSWDHCSYVDYDPRRDEISLCSRRMNEIYIIDHSTTTEEAAGHTGGRHGKGGDILYRWGNPQIYGRGTGDDQFFWGVHGANLIDAGLPGYGGILAFNNGDRPGDSEDRSSVVEIQPQRDADGQYVIADGQPYGPATPDWEYKRGPAFYSLRYGSAFRLPNGNTLICEGQNGLIREIAPDETSLWVYVEEGGVFAAQRYWPKRFGVTGVLDVHPGRCPNVIPLVGGGINPHGNDFEMRRRGVCRVAIAGTIDVDVSWIDRQTIRLEGVSPLRTRVNDQVDLDCKAHGGTGCRCRFRGQDFSGSCTETGPGPDGRDDLLVDFPLDDLLEAVGPVTAGEIRTLTLTATMLDERSFEASDCVLFLDPFEDDDDGGAPREDDNNNDDPGGGFSAVSGLSASPNPFNPSTRIRFTLARTEHVRLAVYDVRGRLVVGLVDGLRHAGEHVVEFKAGENPSGVYFYRLQAGPLEQTKRLILLK